MKKTIESFKDFYGCHYAIKSCRSGYRLTCWTPNFMMRMHNKVYSTHRGAMIALGKISEGSAKPY